MRRRILFCPRRTAVNEAPKRRALRALFPLAFLAALLLLLTASGAFLRQLSSRIAVSDACDIVSGEVNRVIAELMRGEDYAEDSFVCLEKDETGQITAVRSDMVRINALSADILDRVVGATGNRVLRVEIPAGNLSGVSLLMGRGPAVPVQILMLTSSHVDFEDSVASAGINQTRHRITLTVSVDVDVLVPWGTESSRVDTRVLIADTLVVGQVPQTYLRYEE